MKNEVRQDDRSADEEIHITNVPPAFKAFADEVRARTQKPKNNPVAIPQKLSPSEFNTAMVHFYRGEVQRSNVWRNRLDATTNWAVITAGATLSFVFSSADNPHFAIPINSILVAIFSVYGSAPLPLLRSLGKPRAHFGKSTNNSRAGADRWLPIR